jgi:hypothetical protein
VGGLYAYALANRERGTRAPLFSELCDIVGLRPAGGIFSSETHWQSADEPPRLGQVVWCLRRAEETALCRFEPVGEGFVWVEIQSSGDLVVQDQRICNHAREVVPTIDEFQQKYRAAGWVDV